MKTYAPKPRDIERRWYVIDASGAVLGRLASEVAQVLRGKHKPIFAPHADTGDHVVVVNAKGVQLTGGKEQKKIAYRHSGYPGGLTETRYARLLAERPVFVVEKAVRGMLPKNRLGRAMARKLQVYEGAEHPHGAQKPEPLKLGEIPRWGGLPAPRPRREPKPEGPARRGAAKPVTPKRASAKRTDQKARAAGGPSRRTAAKAATAKRGTAKAATAKAAKSASARAAGAEATRARGAKKEGGS